MRLVVWNAAMGLHDKLPVLIDRPDVAVISECANEQVLTGRMRPAPPPWTSMLWAGSSRHKGLGLFTFGEYHLAVSGRLGAERTLSVRPRTVDRRHDRLITRFPRSMRRAGRLELSRLPRAARGTFSADRGADPVGVSRRRLDHALSALGAGMS